MSNDISGTTLGSALAEAGIAAVERSEERQAPGLLEALREHAALIARSRGQVTSDDVREFAKKKGLEPHHPNVWGCLFRGPQWRPFGWKRSRLPGNHGRAIRVWGLVR
jgi:hypothetical protein